MDKKLLMLLRMFALTAIAVFFFSSCGDTADDDEGYDNPDNIEQPDTTVQPEPVNPNAALAGLWSKRLEPGIWYIDSLGHALVLQHEHVFAMGNPDIYNDSSYVAVVKAFDMNLLPETNTLAFTFPENDSTEVNDIVSLEPSKILFANPLTADTTTLRRTGYCVSAAPESIAGFYMSANRFKLHGMVYGPEGKVTQHFYQDDVIDYINSSYTYTPGEGKTAHLSYHVTYHLNPTKVEMLTGVKNYSDLTFDVTGELDLTFFAHIEAAKNTDECYYGEMDGEVTCVLTNHKKNTTTTTAVTGKRLFGLTRLEE